MTKDEALKLALEALEANQPVNYCMNNNGEKFPMMQEDPFRFERNTKAITAIKEALAQQCICGEPNSAGTHRTDGPCLAPQRTWVGLTAEEIDALRLATGYAAGLERFIVIAQVIEAKLKEKNT